MLPPSLVLARPLRTTLRGLSLGASLLLALAGCDEDAAPTKADDEMRPASRKDAGVTEPLAVCDAHLAWVERCQGNPDFGYTKEWAELECPTFPWQHVELSFIKANAACLAKLPCSDYDDVCTGAGYATLEIERFELATDPLFKRCSDVAAVCDEDDGDEHEIQDLCDVLPILTFFGRKAFEDCFNEACARIGECTRTP